MKSQTSLAVLCWATFGVAACGGSGHSGGAGGTSGAAGNAGAGAASGGGGAPTGGSVGAAGGGGSRATGGSPGAAGGGGTPATGGATGGGGTPATGGGGAPGTGGVTGSGGGGATGAAGSPGTTAAAGGLGTFPGLALGPVSDGATITFEMIGAAGMYPSRRDPAAGPCDVEKNGTCCLTNHVITGTQLSPWDEELSATFRGPMLVKQIAVYQPASGLTGTWNLTSSWDARSPTAGTNIAFSGPPTQGATGFAGVVGNKCLVDVSSAMVFPCGSGSVPYCPAPGAGEHKYYGWAGSKMIIALATMPHYGSGAITSAQNCNNSTTDGWYDAPWIGISHGELVRQGLYNGCQCYSYPDNPNAGNGCGQLNAFEIVNDNNAYRNLDVFSTNFFGYGGYVGEGPCGTACNVSTLADTVDLVNKKTSQASAAGAISTPKMGPGAAFRRPATGYRFIISLFDVNTRTVQLAFIHPSNVPTSLAGLLPALPASVPQTTIDAMLALRLPH